MLNNNNLYKPLSKDKEIHIRECMYIFIFGAQKFSTEKSNGEHSQEYRKDVYSKGREKNKKTNMKKIAIVGHGFVGQAIERFFDDDRFFISVFDPKFGQRAEGGNRIFGTTQEDVNACDLAIVCVPTPSREDGSCNTTILQEVLKWINTPLILIKSTTPPKDLESIISQSGKSAKIVFSPEFIGEGKYFVPFWKYPHPTDMKYHSFMIFGSFPEAVEASEKIIGDFFLPVIGTDCRFLKTDVRTAALMKYTVNSWGAMKVTFFNEIAEIANALDVDYQQLRELFLLDTRIERMHTAVFPDKRGYGGKCFPKDVKALVAFSQEAGYDPRLVAEVDASNDRFNDMNKRS